jgi:short-subunit dehydrogenase
LKGKTALVTGSATGIGRAIAFRFAEARAALELVDINEDKLKTVKNELAEYQVAANLHRVDLYYFNLIKCTLK